MPMFLSKLENFQPPYLAGGGPAEVKGEVKEQKKKKKKVKQTRENVVCRSSFI
jgi:hypothetical protein